MIGFAIAAAAAMTSAAYEQHEATKDRRKAIRRERQMAAAQNLRERKQAYRQMVIQQAQMQAAGTNLGVAGSSGLQGGMASIATQTASNIGFQMNMEKLNNIRLSWLDKASKHEEIAGFHQMNAQIFQTMGSSGMGGGGGAKKQG